MAVWSNRLTETPIAVLDFETTGLSPKTGCRVIEIAVVRIEPGSQPTLVLDTLVDPNGPVHATRIHGLTEEDVFGAPLFSDIAANVAQAMQDAVVAAYNAAFDTRFLLAEFAASARGTGAWMPPHVCLMYMRPMLGLGRKCCLSDACAAHGLPAGTHRASDDAMVAARLWQAYLKTPAGAALRLFDDFETGRYSFTDSFDNDPFTSALVDSMAPPLPPGALKPRDEKPIQPQVEGRANGTGRRDYWHALVESLADGVFDDNDLASLLGLQRALRLAPEEIRSVHARIAGEWLQGATEDNVVTDHEAATVGSLFLALRALGWAPGDPA